MRKPLFVLALILVMGAATTGAATFSPGLLRAQGPAAESVGGQIGEGPYVEPEGMLAEGPFIDPVGIQIAAGIYIGPAGPYGESVGALALLEMGPHITPIGVVVV
ncbi:MAG: hypothetical protein GY842_18855 [bacterium]|nr:hypothetical protein [bacterium]